MRLRFQFVYNGTNKNLYSSMILDIQSSSIEGQSIDTSDIKEQTSLLVGEVQVFGIRRKCQAGCFVFVNVAFENRVVLTKTVAGVDCVTIFDCFTVFNNTVWRKKKRANGQCI